MFQIAGGVALILFGVRFLRKSLDRLFGSNLAAWLRRATSTRWRAFGGGCAVACLAPSSTTVALLSLDVMRTGRVPPERMLAVMLGANVGITITVQLLSFDIYSYSAVFLVLGLVGFQFLTRNLFRGIGQFLLSLGFIFLAMEMISRSAATVATSPDLTDVIAILARHPVLLTLLATILTMLLQSSTAVIGLSMALAEGGLGDTSLIVAVVLGANLGTAGTLLLSGWNELELRRTAVANLLLKGIPVAALLATASLWTPWLQAQTFSPSLLAANLHTGFNLSVAAVGLLVLGPVSRFARNLISEDAPGPSTPLLPTTYLDPQALPIPSLALAHASREILLMADTVQSMVTGYGQAQRSRNLMLARGIRVQDDRVDRLNETIKSFLSQISEESLNPVESRTLFTLLGSANELESIGDIVDKNLCDHLVKQLEGNFAAPVADQSRLDGLQDQLVTRFTLGLGFLTTTDPTQAAAFLETKAAFDQECRAAQTEHFTRLVHSDPATLEASAFFLDSVTSYRRINGHLANLAYAYAKAR